LLECPKIIDLDHWKSFNFIVENVNFFGYGSQEKYHRWNKFWMRTKSIKVNYLIGIFTVDINQFVRKIVAESLKKYATHIDGKN
jgi:hypothetical protein